MSKRVTLPWIALALGVLAVSLLWLTRATAERGDVDPPPNVAPPALDERAVELAPPAEVATARGAEDGGDRSAARVPREPPRFPRADTPRFESPPPFASGAIEVRVVHDDGGAPFAGAVVRIPGASLSERGPAPEPARTDGRGVARFENLGEWSWEVVAEAPGCTPAHGAAAISARAPNAVVELRLASRREVLVRLVDAGGRDLAPADLGLGPHDAAALALFLGARCGEIGGSLLQRDAPSHSARAVRAPGATPGWSSTKRRIEDDAAPFRWILEIRGDGPACIHAVLGSAIVAVEPLHPLATSALVRVDRDAVRRAAAPILVRVVEDAGDAPIPGAEVTVAPGFREDLEHQLATDAEGRVRIEGLFAGTLEVSASSAGFVSSKKTLRRPVEGEVVLRLRAGRSIAGVVLDVDDRPLADAFVGAYPAGAAGSSHSTPAFDYVATDAFGRFRFEMVPVDTYVVIAVEDGRSRRVPKLDALPIESALADCRLADVANVVLRAQRPTTAAREGLRR